MELWVRSQDKNRLTRVDDLYIVHDDNNFCDYIGNNMVGHLAKYTKQARALEVLDEIQNILKPQKIIKTIDNTVKIENAIHIVNPTYETITQFDTYVYEMPKE